MTLPPRIQKRLDNLDQEIAAILSSAERHFETTVPRRIAFDFKSLAKDGDLMTEFERAQSVSFVTRYDHLPDDMKVHVVEQDGNWYIDNFWVLRHLLNDFRPLIQNQRDAVYYTRVHSVWYRMLQRTDPNEGMLVRALSEDGLDITPMYSKWLVENKRAITTVLGQLDFGYLYNGILQHSDTAYSKRFLWDYSSGELNYIFWKHIRVLGFIKSLLGPYHRMMKALTFPSLGPL
jgi:hypothetical protein